MLEEITREKEKKIAREILDLARSKLLVNLRFLDMSLSVFNRIPDAEITSCAATDGKNYFYDPRHILSAYRLEENLPVRDYLHVVFHCVFRHMFVNGLVDAECWDLACDIAAESVINDLALPDLNTLKAERQRQFLEGFKGEIGGLSAEKIYRFLLDKRLPNTSLNTLKALFKADEHYLWYLTDEQKRERGIPGYGSAASDDGITLIAKSQLAKDWSDISERMQTDIEVFGKRRGLEPGLLTQNLKEVNRERYDYTEFLKKFAVRGEAMKIDPDEFDYNFYTYGLELYGNLPLIEPLEYKEVKRIREFVIAIDTSGSVAGELAQTFVQKTYNILESTESFFTKINLHIIQCDAAIQEDVKITNRQEFDEYLKNMKLRGFGGTDFRPVFSYVNSLAECGEFDNLKGLIYFTDGFGTFPAKKPNYDAAFIFINDNYNAAEVPPWAIKLVLRKDEV